MNTQQIATQGRVRQAQCPFWVKAIAILTILGGISFVAVAYDLTTFAGLDETGTVALIATASGIAGLLMFAVSWGLFRLNNAARIAAIVIYAIDVIGAVLAVADGDIAGWFQAALGMVIIAYLWSDGVRAAFTGSPMEITEISADVLPSESDWIKNGEVVLSPSATEVHQHV